MFEVCKYRAEPLSNLWKMRKIHLDEKYAFNKVQKNYLNIYFKIIRMIWKRLRVSCRPNFINPPSPQILLKNIFPFLPLAELHLYSLDENLRNRSSNHLVWDCHRTDVQGHFWAEFPTTLTRNLWVIKAWGLYSHISTVIRNQSCYMCILAPCRPPYFSGIQDGIL